MPEFNIQGRDLRSAIRNSFGHLWNGCGGEGNGGDTETIGVAGAFPRLDLLVVSTLGTLRAPIQFGHIPTRGRAELLDAHAASHGEANRHG